MVSKPSSLAFRRLSQTWHLPTKGIPGDLADNLKVVYLNALILDVCAWAPTVCQIVAFWAALRGFAISL